ncbi:MAG: MaoC family dehydratase [Alphaproteobacteria bacterium]
MAAKFTYANADEWIGREVALSPWFTITQAQVDLFAEATHDRDWMHIDPERAKRESPFGGTIAFGFLTLSMLSHFSHEAGLWPEGTAYGVNYGLDRMRLMAPVPVGARIRARFILDAFEPRADGGYRMQAKIRIEIEDTDKPAMLADWIGLFYPEGSKGP